MREIKFRAWSYRNSVMAYPDEGFFRVQGIYSSFTIGGTGEAIASSGDLDLTSESIVFQQYTGVKDANAVDIYEGDIVRCSNEYRTVKMWMGNACLCLDDPTGVPIYPYNVNGHVEVIGNIYENPELLNEEIQND